MKIYGKYLGIGFFIAIIQSLYGTFFCIRTGVMEPLSSFASYVGFANPGGLCYASSLKLIVGAMPFIIYIIIFSTYIYRHFCFSSVYIFSRCIHRRKWFVIETVKLYMFSLAYIVLFVIGSVLLSIICGIVTYDRLGIIMFIHFIIIMSIWLFQITLLGNILSMKWGSQVGATVVCILHSFSVISLAFIDENNLEGIEVIKFKYNIAANLVTGWHGIKGYHSELLNMLDVSLEYRDTYIYVIVLAVVCLVAGILFVEKTEIIQQNREV